MDDERDFGDVFAIPDLYGPSKLLLGAPENQSFLFSQPKLDDIPLSLPDPTEQEGQHDVFFSLPDFTLGLPAEVQTPSQSSRGIATPEEPVVEAEEEFDIWALVQEPDIKVANYQSWDGFEKQKLEQYTTPYITEAGADIFDIALVAKADYLRVDNTENLVVGSQVYSRSLLALGLGRSSVFFTWNEDKQMFVSALPNIRMSGYTGESLDGLLSMFMECGNITRALQSFVDRTYTIHSAPGRIALADSVSSLLATIQSSISSSASSHNTVLQLQSLFQPVLSILVCFRRIVLNVSITRSDEAMLSTIFEEIQLLEHRTDSLREILLEILVRVSQPWLEFAGEWLGLQREAGLPLTKEGQGKSFVRVERKDWIDEQGLEMHEPDYFLDYDKVPSFILPDDARVMFEVGRSLRFLREHHAIHPLARPDVVASTQPPSLEWKFSWQDVSQIEAKALQYERNLLDALRQFSLNDSQYQPQPQEALLDIDAVKFNFFGEPEEAMQAHLLASIDTFNQAVRDNSSVDHLSADLNNYLFTEDPSSEESTSIFAPPISLVPILSFNPIIATQARIVNGTCMRLFFKSHNLREHLSVQRSFHLLGNGVFSSRLSHALFDPDLESAERHRGVARSGGIMGLRLGGRDTWPPASSELRLALMGVLTESYESKQIGDQTQRGTYLDQTTLPGDLSFAVRDMSEEEIDKCMNPDSIEALDFLRLSYKAPAPLDAVITPIILFKYDQLFKLLLRVVRMLYVVTSLFRDNMDRIPDSEGSKHISQRFRIEAHHFISSIAGYFFDTGIEATWRIFDRKLDEIEERINDDGDNLTLGQNEGLDKLRDYHERVLDRIMFALLLRKRQQPVMKLLEEIFALILQFSKLSREKTWGLKKDGVDDTVKELYLKFRKKVGVFITVLRGLSEKKGYGDKKVADPRTSSGGGMFDGDDLVEENTVVQLLVRLEMSGYYEKSVGV